jgi:hypothetical protein
MTDIKTMNIYEKLSAITTEISRVAKNLSVDTGGGKSYKAVGEGDILTAVKPLEDSYRVYSYPASRRVIESGTIESAGKIQQDGTVGPGKKSLFMREEVTYRFVNIDKPEEFVETISIGDGVDPQDKAPGKAATYADKYALMKQYKIQTGDDPDQQGSEELGGYRGERNYQKGDTKKADVVSKFKQIIAMIDNSPKVPFTRVESYIKSAFGKDQVNDLTDAEFEKLKNKIAEELLK